MDKDQKRFEKGQDRNCLREGFEKWASGGGFNITRHAGGGYEDHDMDCWWEVWQAAEKWKEGQNH